MTLTLAAVLTICFSLIVAVVAWAVARGAPLKRLMRVPLFASLALVLALITGCPRSTAVHDAAKAAAGISTALKGVERVNESLYGNPRPGGDTPLLSVDETVAISNAVGAASLCNDAFVEQIKTLKKIDAGNAQQVVAAFGSVSTCLDALNDKAILGVKNPDARAKLSLAFDAVKVSVQALQAVIAAYQPSAASPAKPTSFHWRAAAVMWRA